MGSHQHRLTIVYNFTLITCINRTRKPIDIDSLKVSPYLIVKIKSDTLISEASLEQFKKWIKVRLQTENIEIDYIAGK